MPDRPTTTAGLTLRLVKSVNGIGNKTTLFLEQFIEDIVVRIIPRFGKRLLGQFQPGGALHIGQRCVISLDRDADMRLILQWQGLLQYQLAGNVDGFDCS